MLSRYACLCFVHYVHRINEGSVWLVQLEMLTHACIAVWTQQSWDYLWVYNHNNAIHCTARDMEPIHNSPSELQNVYIHGTP